MNRITPPHTYSPIEFDYKLPPCTHITLDNGIPLYYVNDCIEPVMHLELVFPAGLWYEPKTGVAQATASLIKSGTANQSSFQINETFEQYGATVKAGAGNDWASLSVSCLTKHLDKLLPLLSSLITEAIFPQHEIDIYIQNAKQRLSVQLKKSDFVANRYIDQYLFGLQHPYGRYTHLEDLDQITRDDLITYCKQHYSSSQCKIFMAGQFNDTDVQLVNQYFGQGKWNETMRNEINHPVVSASEKKYRIQHDEKSVQGSIRMIRSFPEKTHPDFSPMIMLNTLFGGYFGSRLMSNIREDKGYTYGIHTYLYNNMHLGAFILTTEAGKQVCEACVSEIYKEMDLLKYEKVSDEELLLVKNYLLGNLLGDLDGAFQIIQRWKNLILNGFTEDRFYNNIHTYKNITPNDLQLLANKYFVAEDFYELVVT
ncbi:MAG: insulinase family protein [Bacteroidetes bacterium]|nr:insulinase family protein [Bacteroidota bacterium]